MSKLLRLTKILLIIAFALAIILLSAFLDDSIASTIIIGICILTLIRFGLYTFNISTKQVIAVIRPHFAVHPTLFIGIIVFLIYIAVMSNYYYELKFKPIAYINSDKETIWSWGEDRKYVYININDANNGKLIDTIMFDRKLLPGRIEIVQNNTDVWIISTQKWKLPFVQAVDSRSFKRTIDFDKILRKLNIDKNVVVEAYFISTIANSFNNSNNSILKIRTTHKEYYYYDILTGNTYNDISDFYKHNKTQTIAYVFARTGNNNIQSIFSTKNKNEIQAFLSYDEIRIYNSESSIAGNKEYTQLMPEKELILPQVLYASNDYVAIVYYTKLGENAKYEISIVSSENDLLFQLKCDDFPSYSLMIENEYSTNPANDTKILDLMKYFSWKENTRFYPDGDNLVLLFLNYGAIKLDLKRKDIIWKYEIF